MFYQREMIRSTKKGANMDKTGEYFINQAANAIGALSNSDKDMLDRIRGILKSAYELGVIEGELKAKTQYLNDLQTASKLDKTYGGTHESH
jgi:hypothetical protein